MLQTDFEQCKIKEEMLRADSIFWLIKCLNQAALHDSRGNLDAKQIFPTCFNKFPFYHDLDLQHRPLSMPL